MTIARQRDDDGAQAPWEPAWDHSAAASCRRWLRRTLQALDLPADAVADAELVATELVANAFVHARPPRSVWLRLLPSARLRITVLDGSTQPPHPRTAQPTDTCGRGLQVVAGLSDRWGSAPRATDTGSASGVSSNAAQEEPADPATTGKAVWAELVLATRDGPVFTGASRGTRHSTDSADSAGGG